jgi:hypothetical protein
MSSRSCRNAHFLKFHHIWYEIMLKHSRSALSHTILSPRIQNCGFWHLGYKIVDSATIDFVTYVCFLLLNVVLNFVSCETKIFRFRIVKTKLSWVQNWEYFWRSDSIKGGINSNLHPSRAWIKPIMMMDTRYMC